MLDFKWIASKLNIQRECVVGYKKELTLSEKPVRAELCITACGVYCAKVNDKRISMPLAPGYDTYDSRMPYHTYLLDNLDKGNNIIDITVGRGWFGWARDKKLGSLSKKRLVTAKLILTYKSGKTEEINTDKSWFSYFGGFKSSDIYNGEVFDANIIESEKSETKTVRTFLSKKLIKYDGDFIEEHERIKPIKKIITPKNETVLDFGQNITGYIEFTFKANKGEVLEISHAEVLDKEGNFYNDNYRSAKAKIVYTCKDGEQTYKPCHTFFGFRYIRLDRFPKNVDENSFTAIVVHSKLKRTGYIESSNLKLNKFFNNVIWSQRGNFFEVPTDCPQRDERQGWTGDAQVFCSTAMYNFDCENFFTRWLKMMRKEAKKYGYTPNIVPNSLCYRELCAGWGDASTVIPYELYTMYGNKNTLLENFDLMKNHVDSIRKHSKEKYLWIQYNQMGDWLALDAVNGSLCGSSNKDLIATAFYAYSTSLLIKAGEILNKNVESYKKIYKNIRRRFIEKYNPTTQTECALTLKFDLTDNKKEIAKRLVENIKNNNNHLMTGFLGTPYLLYALSENGYIEEAYSLLLREEYPSWLYSVNKGATTVWEHWDGINEEGDFFSKDINSFNHYSYGAVVSWIYSVAGGIKPLKAGFENILIEPKPNKMLQHLCVKLSTKYGDVKVFWEYVDDKIKYEIEIPTKSLIKIGGKTISVEKGKYTF